MSLFAEIRTRSNLQYFTQKEINENLFSHQKPLRKLCLLSKRKKLSFSPSVVNATFSRESFWLTTWKYQYRVYISQQEVNPLQTNGELAYVRCLNGRGTLSRIFWNNSYIWCEHWCLWTRLCNPLPLSWTLFSLIRW